jgi:hypothetical protein
MTSIPNPTLYHRWLGWHAPAMRRTVIVGFIGLLVAVVLLWFVPWGMAVVAGWDAAALAFLISVWPITQGTSSPSVENRMWPRSEPGSVPAPHRPEPKTASTPITGRSGVGSTPAPFIRQGFRPITLSSTAITKIKSRPPEGAGLLRWRSRRPITSQTRLTHYESQARNPPASPCCLRCSPTYDKRWSTAASSLR